MFLRSVDPQLIFVDKIGIIQEPSKNPVIRRAIIFNPTYFFFVFTFSFYSDITYLARPTFASVVFKFKVWVAFMA